MQTFNVVGCGRVGKTLAHLFTHEANLHLLGVFNRTRSSAQDAVDWIGTGQVYPSIESLPDADITVITTPDAVIEQVCQQFVRSHPKGHQKIIFHCSGALSSEVLSSATILSYATLSVHPMQSFSNPSVSIQQFAGTQCVLEGNSDAIEIIKPLLHALRAQTYTIDKDKKSIYHAGSVFATNYLVTLANVAKQCFQQAGFEATICETSVLNFMKSVFNNMQMTSIDDSLTGPLMRGDFETIQQHLNCLPDPIKQLYIHLGEATLPLTAYQGKALCELLS